MSDLNKILDDVRSENFIKDKISVIKEKPIDLTNNEIKSDVKDKKIVENKEEQEIKSEEKSSDDYDKKIKNLEKALNDTKRSYQTINQKHVLAKKNYNKVLEELKESFLTENNVLLEKEEYDKVFDKLTSIFTITDEELIVKENEKLDKTDNKGKTISSKLEAEFENYKKYNKSKDLEEDYKAFFESAHLLSAEERENLIDYLENADSIDIVEKVLMMGKDYRELFSDALKKHKNIFSYVGSLKEEINKLNKIINENKKTIDKKSEEYEDKPIYARYSQSNSENKTNFSEFNRHLEDLSNSLLSRHR